MVEAETGKFEVLVVGAGMYVCGKGTEGFGTILPALFEARRAGLISRVHVATTGRQSAEMVREKAARLQEYMGVDCTVLAGPAAKEHDPACYSRMASENPAIRAAVVSVPDHLHFPVTRDLLVQDLHVLVVKPLAPTVAEVRELVRLAAARNLYGAVEYHKRLDEANLKLLDLIRNNRLGRLLNIEINYSQRKSIPTQAFRAWVETTNIFQYLGVHYVDLIRFLTNAMPLRVLSVGMKKHLSAQGIDTWDTIKTLIEWQYPAAGDIFLSSHLTGWVDPETTSAMSDQRLEVVGTRGRYQSDQKHRGVTMVTDEGGVEAINPYFSQFYPALDGRTMTASGYGPRNVLQFLRDVAAINNGVVQAADLTGLRATFASSLPIAAVLEASAQSLAAHGQWVAVDNIS